MNDETLLQIVSSVGLTLVCIVFLLMLGKVLPRIIEYFTPIDKPPKPIKEPPIEKPTHNRADHDFVLITCPKGHIVAARRDLLKEVLYCSECTAPFEIDIVKVKNKDS